VIDGKLKADGGGRFDLPDKSGWRRLCDLLEKTFDIKIDAEDARKLLTVSDLQLFLHQKALDKDKLDCLTRLSTECLVEGLRRVPIDTCYDQPQYIWFSHCFPNGNKWDFFQHRCRLRIPSLSWSYRAYLIPAFTLAAILALIAYRMFVQDSSEWRTYLVHQRVFAISFHHESDWAYSANSNSPRIQIPHQCSPVCGTRELWRFTQNWIQMVEQ